MEHILGTIIAIFGVFGISIVIEKTPIKINPLSMVRNFLVGDLIKKVEDNEKARVKSRANEIKFELFNYEKLVNNGVELNENDIAFVREIYNEYHNDLKQNHLGTIVYENIEEAYRKQKEEKEGKEKEEKELEKK